MHLNRNCIGDESQSCQCFLMGLVFVVKIELASLRFALLQVDFGNKSAYCIIFYLYKRDKSKILLILQ